MIYAIHPAFLLLHLLAIVSLTNPAAIFSANAADSSPTTTSNYKKMTKNGMLSMFLDVLSTTTTQRTVDVFKGLFLQHPKMSLWLQAIATISGKFHSSKLTP